MPGLMIQGTSSNAGKSMLVAGLCRALVRRGLSVAPFKPQNMSNNAAATEDGGEIGRAQALQAQACGLAMSTDMNPVLLKPESERGAQVVVQGRVLTTCSARDYGALKPTLMPRVLESYRRLAAVHDIVLVEGAGSPAEVNLRDGDIANMGFATAANVPVVLVGDIERGGVIASIVGTIDLLLPDERKRVQQIIINKFRGDPQLFHSALPIIEARTGLTCAGIVPWFDGAGALPAEDTLSLTRRAGAGGHRLRVVVPRLPRIANTDDLDPLGLEPGVRLDVLDLDEPLPADADLVLLPGSKATRSDLDALMSAGWHHDIHAHHRRGGHVLGVCGGYQMLGRRIDDPQGSEGSPGANDGLGLLDVETVLGHKKRVAQVDGSAIPFAASAQGYEIHTGRTAGPDTSRPLLELPDGPDGAISADGRVMGCYVHGLMQGDAFRAAYLERLHGRAWATEPFRARIEGALDDLAGHLEAHLEIDTLMRGALGS